MPVLIALTAVIQAFFIYHVYRSGRPYWWAFIILSFPVIGCVAYYMLEIFPGSREHRSARRAAMELARAFNPSAELKRRLEELATCPSVANRIAAAEEFMRCGIFNEAVRLYAEAIDGPHADDPSLLLGLARAHVNNGTFREAQEALARLKALDARYRPEEARLLYRAHAPGAGRQPAGAGRIRGPGAGVRGPGGALPVRDAAQAARLHDASHACVPGGPGVRPALPHQPRHRASLDRRSPPPRVVRSEAT